MIEKRKGTNATLPLGCPLINKSSKATRNPIPPLFTPFEGGIAISELLSRRPLGGAAQLLPPTLAPPFEGGAGERSETEGVSPYLSASMPATHLLRRKVMKIDLAFILPLQGNKGEIYKFNDNQGAVMPHPICRSRLNIRKACP